MTLIRCLGYDHDDEFHGVWSLIGKFASLASKKTSLYNFSIAGQNINIVFDTIKRKRLNFVLFSIACDCRRAFMVL